MVKEMDKDYKELKKKFIGQRAKMAVLSRGSGEKEDMERELETLRQQVTEPTRKIMWVEKSQREAELEQRLARAERTLEEMRGVEKGRSSMLNQPLKISLRSRVL